MHRFSYYHAFICPSRLIANLDEVIEQMDIENAPPEEFLESVIALKEKGIDMAKIVKKFEKNPIRQVAHRFHAYREPFG